MLHGYLFSGFFYGVIMDIYSQNLVYEHNVCSLKTYGSTGVSRLTCLKSKRLKGFEDITDDAGKLPRCSNSAKLDNNLSRAKQQVIELCLCNDFEYFFTGTIDGKKFDRYNLQEFYRQFSKFLNNYKSRRAPDLKYLMIPEAHKDGAIHVHGVLKGLNSLDLVPNKNGYYDWVPYCEKFGYMSIAPIRDVVSCSRYITKYISKDLGQLTGMNKQSFWHSKGLMTAHKEYYNNLDTSEVEWDFKNEYCKVKTYSNSDDLSTLCILDDDCIDNFCYKEVFL